MLLFNTLINLAVFVSPILAAPTLRAVSKYAGAVRPNGYIVTLKDGVSTQAHIDGFVPTLSPGSNITHQYTAINGFAGVFTANDLNTLRASPEVAAIEEDGVATVSSTQTNAPWGLARINSRTILANQNDAALTFTYNYAPSAGNGAVVYVIDTGIYTAHPSFGGRASWGATFGGYPSADGNGHGTHVAGTAISADYGVAKAAYAVAVKVLSDSGSGYFSDVISGIQWSSDQATASGRPSVGSMSLGGGASTAVDNAVAYMTNAGHAVVVAAGNSNTDAANTSPARAPSAETVGASTIADAMAYFSNYGAVVDIFAPGLNVISTWNDGTTRSLSGTSMATPHVSGLVAYLYGLDSTLTPATVDSTLKGYALNGVLSGIPAGTANRLAFNNY